MLAEEEFVRLTAVDLAALVRSREVSAVDVVNAACGRLEHVDAEVRAFQEPWARRAVRAARELDRRLARGERLPLPGVPIGVKASEGTTSTQARRLQDAGCIPIGATAVPLATTEWQTWGHTDRGPTLNPWNPDRVPGGSSAGSAVAVATSIVPLATASDGAGSTRIPAAWCGLVGVKPTNGRLQARDRAGLSVGGPIARTVRDAAAYLSVTLETDLVRYSNDPEMSGSHRAAWSSTLGFADTDPEVADVAYSAAQSLADTGTIVWRQAPPIRLRHPEPVWRAMRAPKADRSATLHARADNDQRLSEVFDLVDLIVTPTTPNRPHGHTGPGASMSVSLTWAFNISGHPAITVPAGFTKDGNPVGLQLIARHDEEFRLIRAAASLERIARWPMPDLRPSNEETIT